MHEAAAIVGIETSGEDNDQQKYLMAMVDKVV